MVFSDSKDFDNAEEFVNFFQKQFCTIQPWDALSTGRGGHIFRGQANSDWKLLPSVFRSPIALFEFAPQLLYLSPEHIQGKVSWLGYHLHAEIRAVQLFLEEADKLGVETLIDYTRWKDHEKLTLDAINNINYDSNLTFPNPDALEELALAQHHGIPTRILDWTESPLIACFFAALPVSIITPGNERIKAEKIAVICFDNKFISKSDDLVIVRAPRHRNNFLRLQQGVFIHMQKSNAYYLKKNEWPSLEDIIGDAEALNGALKKYRLPVTEANNLLRILFDFGITLGRMMPSMNNIAKSYSYASKLFKKF